jgi:hypothetical protein
MRHIPGALCAVSLTCLLWTSCGGGGTGAATVAVVPAAPAITTQPSAQTAVLGQQATFSVVATGTPTPTYQWMKNGVAITGATAASYQTAATSKADLGSIFMVVVSNSGGTVTSSGASLALQWPPQFTTQPASLLVNVADTAQFTVAVDAAPAATLAWQKNGQTINGATAATYLAPGATLADNGTTYLAIASNSVGSQTSLPATLSVQLAPTPVSITAQPIASSVLEGKSTWFTVAAAGTAPLSYQWYKDKVAVSGATTDSLVFAAAALSDAGSYTVVVDNKAKAPQTSSAATLTVSAVPVAPTITSRTLDLALTEGNSATFKVVAAGTAPLAYQWQRNQNDIAGATSDTLPLAAIAMTDDGAQFRCRVSNGVGAVYSTASILTVLASPTPPVISSFTANPTVVAIGASSNLVWATTAARTLSIDNGVGVVTGNTSKAVLPAQVGTATYTLTASNGAGSSTATATVTVNSGPSFPLSVTLAPGILGTPAAGSTPYVQGTIVHYAYSLGPGLVNLQVAIDGANVNPTGSITINGPHNLVATAQAQTLTLTPSAEPGGSISPATPVQVAYGKSSAFTITPDPGFIIQDVLVDGVSVGTTGQYTFQNVSANHTISASFVQVFPLTVTLGPGVASNLTSGNYPAGWRNYAFSLLPGYTSLTVTEDNGIVMPPSGAVLIDGPHELKASAILGTRVIALSVTGNGSISPWYPGGQMTVHYGEIPVLTFYPGTGSTLTRVLVDGVAVATPGNTYTFPSPVVSNHTVQADFNP